MKRITSLLLLLCLVTAAFAQILEPIRWEVSEQRVDKNTVELTFTATIDNGWHLYGLTLPADGPKPTQFNYTTLHDAELEGGPVTNSKLIEKFDEMFDANLNWYEGKTVFTQKIAVTSDAYVIKGEIEYMGCNDESCISPFPEEFEFTGKDAVIAETPAEESTSIAEAIEEFDMYAPVIDQLRAYNNPDTEGSESLWMVFFLGLIGGFVALLTPCVWPIIPMTVSFFLKRSKDTSKGRRDAVLYGLSIIIIYVLLGIIITSIFGASALNSLSTNAFFNLFFFALLVVFAVSFFGAFELTLPASWTSKLDQKAETTSGILSILLMAFTLVLVSFSCTGPIIGTLLVEVSTTGSLLSPIIGMLGFAIALALPFSLFAFFPTWLKSMPRSGGWMNSVKVVLGFLELALSLKFLSVADLAYGWGILDRETFIVLWVVIFAMLGFYLLGKIRLPHDDKVEKISVTRMMLAIVSLAFAIYLIPGLWGAPLRSVSAFSPPLYTQDFNLYENEVHAHFDNYEAGMRYAQEKNKPVLVDFSGFGCVNCRKMEAAVWTNEEVANHLNNDFVLITLMVDDKTPLAKPYTVEINGRKRTISTIGDHNSYIQSHKFGASAQPFYVTLDTEGNPINGSYAFNENPAEFVEYLRTGINNFKK